MEELYPTKTIVWYMQDTIDLKKYKDDASLAHDIFNTLKERMSKNVIRKIYNLLVAPFMYVFNLRIFCLFINYLSSPLLSFSSLGTEPSGKKYRQTYSAWKKSILTKYLIDH